MGPVRLPFATIEEAITDLRDGHNRGPTPAALACLRSAVSEASGAVPYLPAGVRYVEELRALEG